MLTTTTPADQTVAPYPGMMEGKMCEGQSMEECQKAKSYKECMKMMKKTAYKKSKSFGNH